MVAVTIHNSRLTPELSPMAATQLGGLYGVQTFGLEAV